MKKVLIITYYWPPSGGIGVQRWLQLSKNLPLSGWNPVIFTAKDAKYAIYDEKLVEQVPSDMEIHRIKVPEPNNLLSFFRKKGKKSKGVYKMQQQSNADSSLIMKKLLWSIRGNFFIPDARMFWISKSVKYLNKYLAENKIDAIISTGPPHSTHLIAQKLHTKLGIPWVSDFRDPWTSMDYLKQMNLKKFAWKKHEKLEKLVIENSSKVMVVGKTILNEFKDKYGIESELVFNGYNDSDSTSEVPDLDEKFTIVHTGSFLHHRNCDDLWTTLSELTTENKQFAMDIEIKLVGNVAPVVLESLERKGLNEFVNRISHVEHQKAKQIQRSAQLLLLPIDRIENAEFVITGKLFEYLQAKRPILFIGPSQGDAADIIEKCSAGSIVDFDNLKLLKQVILEKYDKFKNKTNTCESHGIDQFSYKALAKKVSQVLENSLHD